MVPHQPVPIEGVAVVLLVLNRLPLAYQRPLGHCPGHESQHLLHAASLEEAEVGEICCQAEESGLPVPVPFQQGYGCELHSAQISINSTNNQ